MAPPNTIREDIISALDTRLKTIKATAGYASNVGSHVFEWREDPLQDGELDALEYRDLACETGPTETIRTWMHKLTVQIRICSKTMDQIRKIIGDLDKAIGADTLDPTKATMLSSLIIERTGDETAIEFKERRYLVCIVTYIMTYPTVEWDQYHMG